MGRGNAPLLMPFGWSIVLNVDCWGHEEQLQVCPWRPVCLVLPAEEPKTSRACQNEPEPSLRLQLDERRASQIHPPSPRNKSAHVPPQERHRSGSWRIAGYAIGSTAMAPKPPWTPGGPHLSRRYAQTDSVTDGDRPKGKCKVWTVSNAWSGEGMLTRNLHWFIWG